MSLSLMRRLQVSSIRIAARGVHAFELRDPSGVDLPHASAGTHIDVHLPNQLVRQYSLAGDPHNRKVWTLGVLKENNGRGGSTAMHDLVRVGDELPVSEPRNAFALAEDAVHSVLIAGGIGITPIKSMAHTLVREGQSFDLHYCAKTQEHAAFLDELTALIPAGRLHLHVDNGQPETGLDINALLKKTNGNTHLYYCGPSGFMKACASASAHWLHQNVHSEHFKAQVLTSTQATAEGFRVTLARSGLTITVPPDQTIVRAVELAGHRVPTSCLSGLCGSCKVNYSEGVVEHNDYILNEEEKKHCLTLCVSRASSPSLVIDL